MIPEPFFQISVVLPICLHLDSREFKFRWNDQMIEIVCQNIVSRDNTWKGKAENMEVRSDEFSHFRFTNVTARIPHTTGFAHGPDLLESHKNDFFQILNYFIACCRVALNRHGLRHYYDYSQFIRPLTATVVGTTNPDRIHYSSISFGEGLTGFSPVRFDEDHRRIQNLLDNGVELSQAFLSDAKGYIYHHDSIHALLSAVIALEVEVSETIRQIGVKKGVDSESIKNFIHDVGLTGQIKATLKLLAPEQTVLPGDEIFGSCKGAITIRNAIMHEGRRDVDIQQVEQLLPHIEEMIQFCGTLNEKFG
jgi:hypothetical protein